MKRIVGEIGMMATEKLYVQMLGDFSIRRGDREVVKKGNRSKKNLALDWHPFDESRAKAGSGKIDPVAMA